MPTPRHASLRLRRRLEALARRLDPLTGGLLRRLLPRRLIAATAGAGVTAEEVRWAYRLLLEREPESEAIVAEKLAATHSLRALREAVLLSPEFRERNPELAGFTRPTPVIAELPGGLRIFVDLMDVAIGQAIAKGTFERGEARALASLVHPGQTAIDCGANVGYFTLQLAHLVGPGGTVHAFEPFPANADLLARSIAENGFASRVELNRFALGAAPGAMQLVHARNLVNSGGGYLAPAGGSVPPGHAAVPVAVRRLDDLPLRRPVSFVKLDVEGAEPLVLAGARRLLEEDRPTLLSEIHAAQLARVAGSSPRALIGTLAALGYEARTLEGGTVGGRLTDTGRQPVLTALFLPRPARPG